MTALYPQVPASVYEFINDLDFGDDPVLREEFKDVVWMKYQEYTKRTINLPADERKISPDPVKLSICIELIYSCEYYFPFPKLSCQLDPHMWFVIEKPGKQVYEIALGKSGPFGGIFDGIAATHIFEFGEDLTVSWSCTSTQYRQFNFSKVIDLTTL
jgi:hypothetical protein